ncbi:ATP-grasp domain-containing protein [Acidiphilium sp.]|uniref:ATP-grasp domain-containing protein n=1 Tax=Acidiphilium sp. TaxID=527 RepID=UPI003D024746
MSEARLDDPVSDAEARHPRCDPDSGEVPPPIAPGASRSGLPRRAAAAGRSLRGLMVCALFTLAYRALRCAADAGVTVFVLGNQSSRGMARSRLCAGYTETGRSFDGTCDEAMIEAVNNVIMHHGIDFVFAGDQTSTRSLIAMAPRLAAPCFPMPDLASFDLLNNKWRFTQLCGELGIQCPPTSLFDDRAELVASIATGATPLPAVIKPLALDGNRGVIEVTSEAEVMAAVIDYRPVLVQRYIGGADIGASVYADRGRIAAYICHRLRRATYVALDVPVVLEWLTRLVAATGVSGILNFDLRLAPDGEVYCLECNPRVFYKMPLSMLLGVNFIGFGLDGLAGAGLTGAGLTAPVVRPPPGLAVRSMKAILASLPTPWRLTRRDFAMLGYIASDPVPYIRENLRIDWEDRSY